MAQLDLDVVARFADIRRQLRTQVTDVMQKEGAEAAKKFERSLNSTAIRLTQVEAKLKTEAGKAGAAAGQSMSKGISESLAQGDFRGIADKFKTAILPAAALAGAVAGVFKLRDAVADYNAEVAKMSNRTGLALDTLSGLRVATEAAGRPFTDLNEVLNPLVAKIGQFEKGSKEAQTTFKRLGIDARDANGNLRSTDEILRESVQALQAIEDPGQRAAESINLLGESGGKLLEILGDGSIETFTEQARILGTEVTPEAAASAREWELQTSQLTAAMKGSTAQFVTAVAEGLRLNEMVEGATAAFVLFRGVIGTTGQAIANIIGTVVVGAIEQAMIRIGGFAEVVRQVIGGDFTAAAAAFDETAQQSKNAADDFKRAWDQTFEDFNAGIDGAISDTEDFLTNNKKLRQEIGKTQMTSLGTGVSSGAAAAAEKQAQKELDAINKRIDALRKAGQTEREEIDATLRSELTAIARARKAGQISDAESASLTQAAEARQLESIHRLERAQAMATEQALAKYTDRTLTEIQLIDARLQRELDAIAELERAQTLSAEQAAQASIAAEQMASEARQEIRAEEFARYSQFAADQFQQVASIIGDVAELRQEQAEKEINDINEAVNRRLAGLSEEQRARLEGADQGRRIAALATDDEKQALKEISVARRKQFFVNQGAAVSEAVAASALAVAQAFAQLGPVAGAIAAPIVGATLALQIARIKSAPPPSVPSFHQGRGQSGRTAPDEVQATILRNEVVATPEQLRDMTRQDITVVQAYNHRLFDSAVRDATARGVIRQRDGSTPRAGRPNRR